MTDASPSFTARFARRLVLAGSLGLLAAAIAAPAAGSGSFQVRPVRVSLAGPDAVEVVLLRNAGTRPVFIQTQAVQWLRAASGSEYRDTRDLIVSPPHFELEPGQEQVVRVGLRRTPDPAIEGTYRIFFSDVPDSGEETEPGLVFRLRMGIPVFVAPERPGASSLEWRVAVPDPREPGRLSLRLANPGTSHVQVKSVRLYGPGSERPIARSSAIGYLLAGESGAWTLDLDPEAPPAAAGEGPVRVVALTDRGEEVAEVALER